MEASNLCSMETSNVALIASSINFSRKDPLSGCRYRSKKFTILYNKPEIFHIFQRFELIIHWRHDLASLTHFDGCIISDQVTTGSVCHQAPARCKSCDSQTSDWLEGVYNDKLISQWRQ